MHKKIILAAAIALIAILSLSFFTACDDEEVQARAIDLDNAQYRIFFDDFSVNSTKRKEKSTIRSRESDRKLKVDT